MEIISTTTVQVMNEFYSYDNETEENFLFDPVYVDVEIFKLISGVFTATLTDSATRQSKGIYTYDWLPGSGGKFRVRFTGGITDGSPVVIDKIFLIGTPDEPYPVIDMEMLEENYTYTFISELEPLFVDPEYVQQFMPEASIVEITEQIYLLSLEMQAIFGEGQEISDLAEEYIVAATLCTLSRIYGEGFAGTNSGGYVLGDLEIKGATTMASKGSGRINVSSWCELAAYLKGQLGLAKIGPRVFVKGEKVRPALPCRRIRSFEKY